MLDLLDYRRRVAEMYRRVRQHAPGSADIALDFRRSKDHLFRTHAQSPLDPTQRASFTGLSYAPYAPDFCIPVPVEPTADGQTHQLNLGDDGLCTITEFAQVHITLPSGSGLLSIFWITGYGGGVFLPFRDATNATKTDSITTFGDATTHHSATTNSNATTYGGGRYLLDTIKGADLGSIMPENPDTSPYQIILDFNYAYHPSCTYNPKYICPLAPQSNKLDFPIPTGELLTS